MEMVPNLQDAFVGAEIVLHMSKDEPLDTEKFTAALDKHKVKMKSVKKDKKYIL